MRLFYFACALFASIFHATAEPVPPVYPDRPEWHPMFQNNLLPYPQLWWHDNNPWKAVSRGAEIVYHEDNYDRGMLVGPYTAYLSSIIIRYMIADDLAVVSFYFNLALDRISVSTSSI